MIRQTLRLALRTSWLGGGRAVLRTGLIAFAAALSAAVACAGLGAVQMLERSDARDLRRSFAPAADGEAPSARLDVVFDAAPDGDQIYVYWWQLLDPAFRVPGVPGQPAPGSWFVSPALAERIGRDGLAARFPEAQVVADDGVVVADELVAHRFLDPAGPAPEVALRNEVEPGHELADGVDLRPGQLVTAGLVVLVVPVLGLVLAAVAMEGLALRRRLAVLDALGASPWRRALLVATQGILTALPGAAAGAALAAWLLDRATSVPLVGRSVLRGDLAVSAGTAAAVALVVAVAVAAAAVVQPRRGDGPRPSAVATRRPGAWRAAPLACGIGLMVVGGGVVGDATSTLFTTGFLTTAVGAVVALPVAYRVLGDRLASSRGALGLLVGRRLAFDARATARALLAVGSLAVIAPVAACAIDLSRLRTDDVGVATTKLPIPAVTGALDVREVEALARRTGTEPLLAVVHAGASDEHGPIPTLLVGDCVRLRGELPLRGCDATGAFEVDLAEADGIARVTGPVDQTVPGVAKAPPGTEVVATMFVGSGWQATDLVLREHMVNRTTRGPHVQYLVDTTHESPVVRWIVGGLRTAVVTTIAALGFHLVAQSGRLARSRRRLVALGQAPAAVRRLAAAEAALTLVIAGVGCTALGAFASWCFVQLNPDARLPTAAIASVGAAVLVTALLSALAAWVTARDDEAWRA